MKKISLPNEQTISAYIRELCFKGVELGKTRIEFHKFLKNEIAALASEFFLTPKKEYVLPGFRSDNRNGYIDVVWAIESIPIVAIEIDSSLREKSVKKLLASNANLLFWVYYGYSSFDDLVNSVDIAGRVKVIHFPTRFSKFGIKSETVHTMEG